MKEIWKNIKGYSDLYQVSNMGEVRRNGKILKPGIARKAYKVSLCKNGKANTKNIHRLVTHAFLGKCPKGKEVNHKDGNRFNNKINNLEYLTTKENHRHAARNGLKAWGERNGFSKLTNRQIFNIRKKYKTGKCSYSQLGKQYNVTLQSIGYIIKKGWKINVIAC